MFTKLCRCKTVYRLSSFNYSTSAPSFPFPKNPNPTPYQIFHLPTNASQDDIKNRYYELVRMYHPDTASSSISSEEAHARFQTISNAYNILRGKSSPSASLNGAPSARDIREEATTAARRAARIRKHRELYDGGPVDDRWKDRIIFLGIIATVIAFVAQTVMTNRQEALQEIAERARYRRLDAEFDRRRRKAHEDPRLSDLEEPEKRSSSSNR